MACNLNRTTVQNHLVVNICFDHYYDLTGFLLLLLFSSILYFMFCLMRIFIEIHEKLPTCSCFMRATTTMH